MITSFHVQGMSCGSCKKKVEEIFLAHPKVLQANVDLANKSVEVESHQNLDFAILDNHLSQQNNKYSLTAKSSSVEDSIGFLSTYKPLILIIGFLLLATLIYYLNGGKQSMSFFMGAFFIVFSFFKFLDLSGFSNSFQGYDVLAKIWKPYGWIYPFIELGLGVSYLLNYSPILTNIITAFIMGLGLIGVVRSVLSKKKIQCACLGTGFNLPMSSVTIIEDATMLLMALFMLSQYV